MSVGRIGKLECDFIARKGDEYAYIQVSMTVADPDVERCEYAPSLIFVTDGRVTCSRSIPCAASAMA